MLGSNVTLRVILKVILHYISCLDGQIEYPLFIIKQMRYLNQNMVTGFGKFLCLLQGPSRIYQIDIFSLSS